MNRTERFYKIDQLINDRQLVPFRDLQEALEISRATLKRDLEYMRNRLNAPIVWDRAAGGYRFESQTPGIGGQYELPGLWFSSQEIHALLTMQHLLANLDQGGMLAPHVAPLMARLNGLLGCADGSDGTAEEIRQRVLIVGIGKRAMKLAHFEKVGSALLRRKRLHLHYYARGKAEVSEREVSPQRLVHYRENWYLDAWCHLRRELRNFAIDSIQRAEVIEKPAREVSNRTVDAVLGPGYGIFGGRALHWATLRFSPTRARWVASEFWHPKQKGRFGEDGSYLLEIPYSDPRELTMDILKYGPDCEVIAPEDLRESVAAALNAALARYTAAPVAGSEPAK
jgi:predicted DNA-binding transcriptional regulator YafY